MTHTSPTETGNAGAQTTVSAALPQELVDALDRFIASEQQTMTRSEALRAAFRDWAVARGLVESADDGLRPAELNASNDG